MAGLHQYRTKMCTLPPVAEFSRFVRHRLVPGREATYLHVGTRTLGDNVKVLSAAKRNGEGHRSGSLGKAVAAGTKARTCAKYVYEAVFLFQHDVDMEACTNLCIYIHTPHCGLRSVVMTATKWEMSYALFQKNMQPTTPQQ